MKSTIGYVEVLIFIRLLVLVEGSLRSLTKQYMQSKEITTESLALQGGGEPLKTPLSLVLGGDEGCV